MHTRMMQWSRGLYIAGMVLALVLVIPAAWFPFQLAKIAACAVCILASVVLFALGGGPRDLLRSHGLRGALVVLLLPVAYGISWFFSTDTSVATTGFAIETDTIVFVSLATVTYLMGFALFRTMRTARLFLGVLAGALAVAALFQFVSVLFGQSAIPLAAFADKTQNLVGKWNDLGILLGLLLVFMLAYTQFAYATLRARAALMVGMALLVIFLGLINFAVVWGLVLAAAFGIALVSFLSARADQQGGINTLPVLPLVVAVVAGLMLVWGSAFNSAASGVFPVSSLEVRPSYQTTLDVINAAREESITRLLVGTGPNTFGHTWVIHKPAEVNQSQFWNLDFNVGYSTLLTAFGTVGLLGALAWLVPLVLLVVAALRVVRAGALGREDRNTAMVLVVGSLLLAATVVFYVPSSNLVLLMMALCGAAFGFLYRQGQSAATDEPVVWKQYASLAFLLVLVVSSCVVTVVSARRLAAEALAGAGAAALADDNIDSALSYATRARAVDPTGDTLRFAANAGARKLQALAQDTATPPADVQKLFTATLQDTLTAATAAQTKNPDDYRPTFVLAQVYDLLAQLKVTGAATQAQSAYDSAAQKDPTNPQIPLLRARLEAVLGNSTAVEDNIKKALTLKPNYTDAMLFVAQLAVANNDLQTALQAAQAAVQSAPGVPSLWFELGLLAYSGGDTKDAIPVLEQALVLQPDYANAKYFLGLSYWAQGRHTDALAQFRDLAKTNPDNAEVASIVANMEAGKEPFAGATAPNNTPPQSRTTAPVAQ